MSGLVRAMVAGFVLAACGGARGDAASGAPCTRSRDCVEALVCCAGTCAPEPDCTDAAPDAAPDGGS